VDHELFFVDYYHCGRELGLGRRAVYMEMDAWVGEFIWGTARRAAAQCVAIEMDCADIPD
jgi:hypothetical protein